MPRSPDRAVWRTASAFVGLGLLLAATGKAWSFPQFCVVVRHLMPEFADAAPLFPVLVAAAVVAWESFLAVCFLSLRPAAWTLWGYLVTLLVFTGVLVLLWRDPAAPPCSCFGLIPLLSAPSGRSAGGFVRNGALVWIVAWILQHASLGAEPASAGSVAPAPSPADGSRRVHGGGPSRAFTLIDVLVAISVIAVLLALALPSLFRTRQRATTLRSLALQRQAFVSVELYAAGNRGFFPYIMTPGNPDGPKVVYGFDLPVAYFRAGRTFWPNVVVPDFAASAHPFHIDPETAIERNLADGYPPQTIRSRYQFTCTAFADAEYWVGDDVPASLDLLRGTQVSAIRHPAHKGLTVDITIGAFSDRDRDGTVDADAELFVTTALGDGSARAVPWFRGEPDWSRVVERPHGALPWPIFSTRGGLAGTDF